MNASLLSATVIGLVSRSSAIEALGWTLLHFLWQGTAVSLMFAVFFGFGRRLSPQARYVAGCAALALMTLSASATFVWQISGVVPEREAQNDSMASTALFPTNTGFGQVVAEAGSGVNVAIDKNLGSDRNLAVVGRLKNAGETAGRRVEMVDEPAASPIQRLDISARRFEFLADGLRPWLRWLVGLWGAGVGLLSLRLAHGWRTIHRVRVSARELTDPVWTDRFARLHERLGVSTPVRLLGSASASVPMVIGWLKPAVLVPAGMLTGLSAAQIEALLVHELAHIRRHDYIVNLLQNVIETLFFYHPAVWWVSAQIRKEREHCCDDAAAAACGVLDYAQALASLAESRHIAPGFGLAANSAPVVDRIRRLAGIDAIPGRPVGWLAVPMILVLGTCFGLVLSTRSGADEQQKTGLAAGTPPPPAKPAVAQVLRKVAGRVVDHGGKPVAAARVWWMLIDHGFRRPTVLAERTSDAAGRFRMEVPSDNKSSPATPRNEQLWVLARGRKFSIVGDGEKLPITEGATALETTNEVVIHLDPATDFVFQVNDCSGKPVSGATLERIWTGPYFPGALFGETPAEPEWPAALRECDRATTDASGQAHLTASSYQMRIAAPGFGMQTIRLPEVEERLFPIGGKARYAVKQSITLRPAGRVEGRIVADDARRVRGIKLRINTYWEEGGAMAEGSAVVTADDDGRFIVPAIAEGNLRFRFLDGPHDSSLIPIARPADVPIARTLNVQANETTRLEIRLAPRMLVEGLVQADRTGEPVPGAEIFLGGAFQLGDKMTSDDRGRYRAPFAARKVSLQAIKLPEDGHADYQQWFSVTRPGRTAQSVMQSPSLYKVVIRAMVDSQAVNIPAIVRIPTKMLEGKAIDTQGRPLVNAVVKADNGLGRYAGTTDIRGEFEMQVPKSLKVESYDVSLRLRLVTNVKVEKPAPLVLKVDSISETGGPEFAHPIKSSKGPQKTPEPREKSKPDKSESRASSSTHSVRRVAGRVVDHEGQPIQAARLWWVVLWSRSHAQDFTVAGTSDADGRFEMTAPAEWKPEPPLRQNAGVLWFLSPGKVVKKIPADESVRDGIPADLVVQLDPATEIVYKVNDPLGRPVPGAVVEPQQFFLTGATTFFPEALSEALRGITDKSGIARLRSIPRHVSCTVRVTAPGFGTQSSGWNKDDATAAERTLKLRPVGRIEGRLDAEDPHALRGVRILFQTEGPQLSGQAIVTTDDKGRFVVPAIAEGQVRIGFLDNPAKQGFLPRVPWSLTLDAGQTLNADMQMMRPILVKGSIRTQDTQQPVVGAEIGVAFQGLWDNVISDAQGRYEAHVLPGSVHMQVIDMPPNIAAGYTETGESMSRGVEVHEGATPFELPPILVAPTETIAGTLIDRIGRRLANARVCGNGDRRQYGFALTNAEGEFAVQLPKQISVDSFEVWLPDQAEPAKSVKIMKYRPLVLCVESFSQPEAWQRKTGDKHSP